VGALIPPSTQAESQYGVKSSSYIDLSAVASSFDSGDGFVSLSLTKYGKNPYANSASSITPLLLFDSDTQSSSSSSTTSSSLESSLVSKYADFYDPRRKYSLVFQFAPPINFSSLTNGNETFGPACSIFNPQSDMYSACRHCNAIVYSDYNVTFE